MEKKKNNLKGLRKKTDIRENAGKVLVNLGQVIFATLFLGGVIRGEIPPYLMMVIGAIAAVIFIFYGLLLSAKEQKEKEV